MYTIKPLEWEPETDDDGKVVSWKAAVVFGWVAVYSTTPGVWRWTYYGDQEIPVKCDSADDGKRQAEAYYLSRLMPALEPVQ